MSRQNKNQNKFQSKNQQEHLNFIMTLRRMTATFRKQQRIGGGGPTPPQTHFFFPLNTQLAQTFGNMFHAIPHVKLRLAFD
jgi:hypothetical protein